MLRLEADFDEWQLPWRSMVASGSMVLEREVLGFELGGELRAQLQALSAATLAPPRALRCDVIDRRGREDVAHLLGEWKAGGLAVTEVVLEHEFDWLAHEAMSTALVPLEPVQLLADLVNDLK